MTRDPTPADIRIAARLIDEYTNWLQCSDCGGRWIVAKSGPILFHKCAAPPQPGYSGTLRTPEQFRQDQRIAWARTQLGSAGEDAVASKFGIDKVLRVLEEEE